MTDDREAFKAARDAGLRKRHQQRLKRALTVHGVHGDKVITEPGRGTVYLTVDAANGDIAIAALTPDAADALAACLARVARLARPAVTVDSPTFPNDTKEETQ